MYAVNVTSTAQLPEWLPKQWYYYYLLCSAEAAFCFFWHITTLLEVLLCRCTVSSTSTVWPCQLISWCCQWCIFPRGRGWTWCPRARWQSARLWTRVAGSATLAGVLYTNSGSSSCQQARVAGRVVAQIGYTKNILVTCSGIPISNCHFL